MEPNIPVGSEAGVASGMKRAVAGAEREQREGASGKWVAHWKMVHIVRPVWEKVGQDNQLGRKFPPLDLHCCRRGRLFLLEPAPRTVRGARDLLSVALQYGNAFLVGTPGGRAQAGGLFRQRRRPVSDGRHGDRRDPSQHPLGMAAQERVVHRGRREVGVKAGDRFTPELFQRLLAEEYEKLRNGPATATSTTTRRTRRCRSPGKSSRPTSLDDVKLPWYIDLLNINLDNHDLADARSGSACYMQAFQGRRHPDHGEPGLLTWIAHGRIAIEVTEATENRTHGRFSMKIENTFCFSRLCKARCSRCPLWLVRFPGKDQNWQSKRLGWESVVERKVVVLAGECRGGSDRARLPTCWRLAIWRRRLKLTKRQRR